MKPAAYLESSLLGKVSQTVKSVKVEGDRHIRLWAVGGQTLAMLISLAKWAERFLHLLFTFAGNVVAIGWLTSRGLMQIPLLRCCVVPNGMGIRFLLPVEFVVLPVCDHLGFGHQLRWRRCRLRGIGTHGVLARRSRQWRGQGSVIGVGPVAAN